MIGEQQKGHVYYRCHDAACPSASLREETIAAAIEQQLAMLAFTEDEREVLRQKSQALTVDWSTQRDQQVQRVKLQLERFTFREFRKRSAVQCMARSGVDVAATACLLASEWLDRRIGRSVPLRRATNASSIPA